MTGKPAILCVDDTLSVLEGRQVLLVENGYEVLTATGGKEAVQLFVSESGGSGTSRLPHARTKR